MPGPLESRVGALAEGGAHGSLLFAAALGVFATTAMLLLWLALAAVSRDYPQSTKPESWLRIVEMVAHAVLGLLASLKMWPLFMLVIFAASFFPIGLYMLGVPSVFRLIGVADLLYLIAALWLMLKTY